MTSNPDIHRVNDPQEAAAAALAIVLKQAQAAIAQRGRFVLGLSGGNTPRQLYRLLAQQDLDWSLWHLVYGETIAPLLKGGRKLLRLLDHQDRLFLYLFSNLSYRFILR